jgi:hypothetical protein
MKGTIDQPDRSRKDFLGKRRNSAFGDAINQMNDQARRQLERHRADYAKITGAPFQHFFCPILFVDEPAKLMRGHIINEAFKGSPGAWVIQREGVDSFYGRYFEGDYQLYQHMIGLRSLAYFFEQRLFSAARPRVFYEGRELHYFIRLPKDYGKPPPPGFGVGDIEYNGQVLEMCIELHDNYPMPDFSNLELQTEKDLRVPAFVSLLKAAHLSLYSMFGYHYVFEHAGRLIGQDLLGGFYKSNRNANSKKQVQEKALDYFWPYRHMVLSIAPNLPATAGTLSDGIVHLCAGSIGPPWGMIIYVKAGPATNAVLMPFPGDHDALATFLDFLRNDHEQIHVMIGQHCKDTRQWAIDPTRQPARWRKDTGSYPDRNR